MSFPRYPAYKDSGVTWLGEVPSHWEVKRLRRAVQLNPSKSETNTLPRSTEVTFLPMEAIGEDGSLVLDRVRPIGELEAGYTYFAEDDVAIAKITPCFENGKGAVMRGLHGGLGFGTTELIVARPLSQHLESTYLHRIFTSRPFMQQGEASMYGAGGQKRVPDDFVRGFAIALPPVDEQAVINAFLDRETAKIDALVAEQVLLITLLKEKRQAVISHAVTKGLDPSVPMKDSGVEWLGKVPAHWQVKQLRHVARIVRGASPRPAGDPKFFSRDESDETNVPWVTVAEITKDDSLYLTDVIEFLTPLGADASQRFERDTVIFSNSGATLGVPKILAIDCCANDGVLAFKNLDQQVHREFLYFFLSTTTERLRTEMKQGGGQPNLNTDIVKNIGFAVPSLDEQVAIVSAVQQQTARFNDLICEARRGVGFLQERRSALISAAVTGQIDVRGLAT